MLYRPPCSARKSFSSPMAFSISSSGAASISACRALSLKRQNLEDGGWTAPGFSKLHTFSEIGNHKMGSECFFTLVLLLCNIIS